jgi:hypothetical protein
LNDTTLLNLNTRFSSKLNLSDTVAMLTPYFRDADTTLLNLTNRFNTKLNISDTASMLLPYFRDADTSSLNLTSRFASKLNTTDTASLSSRIDTKGTVSSVATGFGLLGGTITTTGTLLLDSAVVFTRIRDSIVDVAIGNDTIKILKQEYAPATTSVLTWTITSKFPIQLKAYILVFRNGQLLNNDQYNLTDTNKITIVSTSFKVGANYTVATVSGIGSIGTGVFPNPVYPDAGIALSTGSAWASSIPNNSSNWNIAYNDKINNAVFTGTDTKTLTLTQLDGGTFVPTFTDLQGVTGVTAGTGLTGGTISTTGTVAADTTFLFTQSDTLSLNLTSRFAAKQNILNGTGFIKASGTNITFDNSTYLTTSSASSTYLPLTGGTLTGGLTGTNLNLSSGLDVSGNFTNNLNTNISALFRGYQIILSPNNDYGQTRFHFPNRPINFTFSNYGSGIRHKWDGSDARNSFLSLYTSNVSNLQIDAISINSSGNVGIRDTTPSYTLDVNGTFNASGNSLIGGTLGVTGNITEDGNNVLTNLDTASLSSRIDSKVSLTGDQTISGTKTFNNLVNLSSNLILSGSYSSTNKILGKNSSDGVGNITVGSGLNLTSDVLNVNSKITNIDTSQYSITSTDVYLDNKNSSSTTIILPLAGLNVFRELKFKNSSTGALIANGNIIPLSGSGTTTTILPATNAKWCTLVSDGTDWIIMQSN